MDKEGRTIAQLFEDRLNPAERAEVRHRHGHRAADVHESLADPMARSLALAVGQSQQLATRPVQNFCAFRKKLCT